MSHQMSIMVIPGLIQLLTYARTCRCASAACLKSFHISSLARSSARFSSLVVRHAALRLAGDTGVPQRRRNHYFLIMQTFMRMMMLHISEGLYSPPNLGSVRRTKRLLLSSAKRFKAQNKS